MTVITAYDAAQALPGWHAGGNLLHIPLTDLRDRSESLWHAIVLPADRPEIVCLCGSTRFRDEFARANRELTLSGVIVVAPGVFAHSGDALSDGDKVGLDELHKRKIDLADEVLIVSDESGYYGESTRREIAYARALGKPVKFLAPASEENGQQAGEAS